MTYNFVTDDATIRGKRSALDYIIQSQLNPADDMDNGNEDDESATDRESPEEEYI
jgi:hypothetical protein